MFFQEICRNFHGIFHGNMVLSQHFKQSNRKKKTIPVDFTARSWMTSGNFGNDMGI
jgi:hypothetical protein